MNQDDPPEYLKKFTTINLNDRDNFDHTDVVWTGKEGNLDPDEMIKENGWGGRSPLLQLVSALVAGYQPSLSSHELDTLARKIESKIQGTGRRGAPEKDDSALLLEVAYRFHRAHHETRGQQPALLPICEAVATEYRKALGREGSDENLPKTLAKKFNQERDLWLARATMGDDYYAPGRMSTIRKISTALKLLQEVGISTDGRQIVPSIRPEGLLRRKAK